MRPDCLIIDDVATALNSMSPFGRQATATAAALVREAVIDFANRRRWTVLPYDQFVTWARSLIHRSSGDWLVLDPIFPLSTSSSRVKPLRVTRATGVNQHRVGPMDAVEAIQDSPDIAILDDAAATGGTLRTVAGTLAGSGRVPTRFALAACTDEARAVIFRRFPSATLDVLQRGNWRICHLRDGCPHLPFTGRATTHKAIEISDGKSIEARETMATAVNNLWQVLYLDSRVKQAAQAARIRVAEQLAAGIGRPATVADLALLGQSVPVLLEPGQTVSGDALLRDLCLGTR